MVGMGPETEGKVGGTSTGGVAGGVDSSFDDDGAEAVAPSIQYMLMFHLTLNFIQYP